uniref:ZnMc domain-containing protein n=1 Tax=Parastrongyloides trichosuri TaxID=131310 RepID=A0A0N4ZUN3_PARTI
MYFLNLSRHFCFNYTLLIFYWILCILVHKNGINCIPIDKSSINYINSKSEIYSSSSGYEIVSLQNPDISNAIEFLNLYGYIHNSIPTNKEFSHALKRFQDFNSLDVTGNLDSETLYAMDKPRCGNPDYIKSHVHRRSKRFQTVAKWENKIVDGELSLKWYIGSYTKDMSRSDLKQTVQKAFYVWSSQHKLHTVSKKFVLSFNEAESESDADIVIKFAEGDHGDQKSFDGPGSPNKGNILAHTFFPNKQVHLKLNGDIHLDDYENWVSENSRKEGVNLLQVLIHEIGHSLGLGHSKKKQSVMFLQYKRDHSSRPKLDIDDMCGLYWTYIGKNEMCLQYFTLSDVAFMHTASDYDEIINDQFKEEANLIDKIEDNYSKDLSYKHIKKLLKHSEVPLCKQDPRIERHFKLMLSKHLSFSDSASSIRAKMMCAFYEGLHKTYNTGVTIDLEKIRIQYQLHDVKHLPIVNNNSSLDETDIPIDSPLLDSSHYNEEYFEKLLQLIYNETGDMEFSF